MTTVKQVAIVAAATAALFLSTIPTHAAATTHVDVSSISLMWGNRSGNASASQYGNQTSSYRRSGMQSSNYYHRRHHRRRHHHMRHMHRMGNMSGNRY